MRSAIDALHRLSEGNRRFVQGVRSVETLVSTSRRADLVDTQQPFAAILGCSDSRVPVEIVFDQGLGDLFVIRVAGNVVAPSQVGSVEFAAERFGTRLVVVLGPTRCGAVQATLEELQSPGTRPALGQSGGGPGHLGSIVDRIVPAVRGLVETDLARDPEALAREAVRANVRVSADHLRHGSAVLERLIESDGRLVVGAEYALETGEVEFFDGVPASAQRAG